MFNKSHRTALAGFFTTAALVGAILGTQGCGEWSLTGEGIHCGTNPDPETLPFCAGDAGAEDAGAGLKSETCNGQCVPQPPVGFDERPALVWMGPEEEEPQCPDRALSIFDEGYEGLTVALPCQKCECEPAKCVMSTGLVTSSNDACQGGAVTNYDAPADWDGSCISPAQVPAGSFRSIELTSATVSSCKPMGDTEPQAPSFAPTKSSFAGGVYWKNRVLACSGTTIGECKTTDFVCVPNTQPPPPEFRYCIASTDAFDENNLPQCPNNYPERFTIYKGTTGKVECSPCECGDPVGAQCTVSFSAYQDPTCSGVPMPLFENVPAVAATCIDFGAMSVSLDSMSAKWSVNQPGQCLPKGGELVGEVKPLHPRMYCCQPLEPPMKAPKE